METRSASSAFSKSILPWLFPFAYLIHTTEEYFGGGALHAAQDTTLKGVDFTARQFLIINCVVFLLFLLLIFLSQKFKFPEWVSVYLGTVFFINAIAHTISTLMMADYSPGLITGWLILMPLGALTLLKLRSRMSTRRYLTAMAVGIGTHGIISLLTLRGGHLFRL